MEKKIGIVAPHRSSNFGTALQAYALAQVIHRYGYICEYITYSVAYKHSVLERVWNKLNRIVGNTKRPKLKYEGIDDYSFMRSAEFQSIVRKAEDFYRQFIPHSERIYNPKTIWRANFTYDKFIVGSDQTWSMEQYDYYKAYFFLSFVIGRKRKYAYAPSLGTIQLSEQHKQILSYWLRSFATLSCREKNNSIALSQLLQRKVTYVADPTLLLNKDEWRVFANPVVELPKRYILAYILGEKDCVVEFAEKLAKKKGLPVYYLLTRPKYLSMPNILNGLSPQQWIYAIANADCVVTDSFHGSLFCINLERDFYVFNKRPNDDTSDFNDNDRIIDLLSPLGLQSRLVADDAVNDYEYTNIDYKQVNLFVDDFRATSLKYLSSILSK